MGSERNQTDVKGPDRGGNEKHSADRFDPSMTKKLLAAIVEGSDDAIISKTLDGTIQSWNGGATRIFGYTADEAVGQNIDLIVPPELRAEERSILAQLRRGERIAHFETERITKDGRRLTMSITVSPILDEAGHIVGASKVGRNVSERKEAERLTLEARNALENANAILEERVEEKTADLAQFSYQVSHDLRSPLRVIEGFSRAALEDYGDQLDETGRMYLERIAAGAARMDKLLVDLLEYNRLGRSKTHLESVSIHPIIEQVLATLDSSIQASGAQIQRGNETGKVLALASSLTLVLENLIGNALKFVAPGVKPRVQIVVEDIPGKWRISVSDNGLGIASEHQARIWSVFERLHGEEEYPGTGIGLAIVKRSIKNMSGTCGVESSVGEGSRFWIELSKGPKHE
jgi:PAS domain S-box-containing protein